MEVVDRWPFLIWPGAGPLSQTSFMLSLSYGGDLELSKAQTLDIIMMPASIFY